MHQPCCAPNHKHQHHHHCNNRATVLEQPTSKDTADKDTSIPSKKRVNLSLHVGPLNGHLSLHDLLPGLVMPAAVHQVEDHGYMLELGIKVCGWVGAEWGGSR